ncbi:serine/threonine-protein kinase ripk4 [Histoplasma capsulatum]|uniref:Serine/threonine-protein kinase ripk4 n=1 Tax=Ajellomyces capsulatus TaxID=5037 RepID=A0A8A1MCD3_AJECA|nr:serine/threonine-protein kinase ripk4 [Histoplasma capsulatum]
MASVGWLRPEETWHRFEWSTSLGEEDIPLESARFSTLQPARIRILRCRQNIESVDMTNDHEARKILPTCRKLQWLYGVQHEFDSESLRVLEAVSEGNEDELLRLLDNGVDLRAVNSDGLTALHLAVALLNGHANVALALLRNKANIDALTPDGHTLLFSAVMHDDLEIIEFLLDNGANKYLRDDNGETVDKLSKSDHMLELLRSDRVLHGPPIERGRAKPEIHYTVPSLPTEETDKFNSCQGFQDTIIDFILEGTEKRIDDMLYGKGPEAIMNSAKKTKMDKPASFSRHFGERESGAIVLREESKSKLALVNGIGQQYRASSTLSSYMRPLCRTIKVPFLHFETHTGYERMAAFLTREKNRREGAVHDSERQPSKISPFRHGRIRPGARARTSCARPGGRGVNKRASSDTRNYFHMEDLTRPGTDIPARNTISPRVAEPLPSPSTNIAKTHSQNYLSENANYPGRKLGIFRLILAGKERHMRLWTSTPRMIPPRTKILLSLGLMVIKLRESTSLLMLCPEAPELELLLIFLGMTANRQMQQQIELNLKARNLGHDHFSHGKRKDKNKNDSGFMLDWVTRKKQKSGFSRRDSHVRTERWRASVINEELHRRYQIDQETKCFGDFAKILPESNRRKTPSSEIFSISAETKLLVEIKDIIDELGILHMILSDQTILIEEFSKYLVEHKKPKNANPSDDHSSPLPLSFMAAFFAINIDSFPWNKGDKLPMDYVLRYMFSISGAISIPFILIALNQDRIAEFLKNHGKPTATVFIVLSLAILLSVIWTRDLAPGMKAAVTVFIVLLTILALAVRIVTRDITFEGNGLT